MVDVTGTTTGTGAVSAGSIVFSTGTRALSSGIGLSNSFRGISKMKSSALFLMGMKSSKFWIRAGSLDGRASVAVCVGSGSAAGLIFFSAGSTAFPVALTESQKSAFSSGGGHFTLYEDFIVDSFL